ncbi:hypothetical protein Mapa_006664 [Marchantia paleacea]|nr:hypothetical protein Mapa_006664 [Marchantia paleacea]
MATATACCGVRIVSSSLVSSVARSNRDGSRVGQFVASASNLNFGSDAASTSSVSLKSSALSSLRQRNPSVISGVQRTRLRVDAAVSQTKDASKVQTKQWTWTFEGTAIKINLVEFLPNGSSPTKTLVMLPTISDVSTTEEWHAVAEGLLSKSSTSYRIVCVDFPGLGLSDRPGIDYTADLYEKFLVDIICAKDGPICPSSGGPPVIIGGGHSATIAARAISRGLLEASALALVAPTWAGPLPIVFGREPNMETRYGVLRNTLRSPGVGWAMYKYLVSSPKNIRLQYLTHVYADADNVTPSVVESRTALTQREGARFAPTAFLTGLLDPTRSREEFLGLFANLEGKLPTLVVSSVKSPKRSKAEMEALEGVKGVTKFVKVPGALLPQEEYPDVVCDELVTFLQSVQ